MKQISFVAAISYYWQQQWQRWASRLAPLLLSIALSTAGFCVYRWYQLQAVQAQVRQLELGLVDFEQAVRTKQDLAAEQARLTAQLAVLRVENHAAVTASLVAYLTAIAGAIPTRMYLTELEITPGAEIKLQGWSRNADLIVRFWQKLLSLAPVLDGKLENQLDAKTPPPAGMQQAFQMQLKVKAPVYDQDQAVISAGNS